MSDFEFNMPHYLNYLVFPIGIHTIFIDPFIDSLVLCPLNSELRKRIMICHISFLICIEQFSFIYHTQYNHRDD